MGWRSRSFPIGKQHFILSYPGLLATTITWYPFETSTSTFSQIGVSYNLDNNTTTTTLTSSVRITTVDSGCVPLYSPRAIRGLQVLPIHRNRVPTLPPSVTMDDDLNSSDVEVEMPFKPFASAGAQSIADMLDASAINF
jgi:hypothetical protein